MSTKTAEIYIPNKRGSRNYDSPVFDHEKLYGLDGQLLVQVTHTPQIQIPRFCDEAKKYAPELREIPIREVLSIFRDAADKFELENIPLGDMELSPKEHAELVTLSTGLPLQYSKRAIQTLAYALRNMEEILRAQTPYGDIEGYDSMRCRDLEHGFQVAWIPLGDSLGAIMPSNHPAVDTIWLTALATKYPTLIKSGKYDPFTRMRLAESLYSSGLPQNALYILYGPEARRLITEADRGIIFGNTNSTAQYLHHPTIKAYGPGQSKAIVSQYSPQILDILYESIIQDGGMGCINLSAIASLEDYGKRIAQDLAEKLDIIEVTHPLSDDAILPAMNKEQAEQINSLINQYLSSDGVQEMTTRANNVIYKDGFAFLRPRAIYVSPSSPAFSSLFGLELPFPFVTVSDVGEDYLLDIPHTLTVTVLPPDRKIEEILLRTQVEKVYSGRSTLALELTDPHGGFITDHLFHLKAWR